MEAALWAAALVLWCTLFVVGFVLLDAATFSLLFGAVAGLGVFVGWLVSR